jgi:hypothetical protein
MYPGADRDSQPRISRHHHHQAAPSAQPCDHAGQGRSVRHIVMAEHDTSEAAWEAGNRWERVGQPA